MQHHIENPLDIARIKHQHIDVEGLRVFYRESLPAIGADAPVLLLLHGFPSASHQFRRLFDVLGSRHRLIAPDYPGFGHSDAPEPASLDNPNGFTYSFDRLADVVEGFVERLQLDRFVMYVFDFGAPVGFRLATGQPDRIAGLIIQNANAYDEGLSDGARDFIALRPEDHGSEDRIRDLLTLPATRGQYEGGTSDPALVAPDGWTLDQHFLDQPGRDRLQIDLAYNYKSNLARYPEWQAWMRAQQPPALIIWGRNDQFFPESGARAYLRDLPDAELHVFDTGHFALEENLPETASLIADFCGRTWKSQLFSRE